MHGIFQAPTIFFGWLPFLTVLYPCIFRPRSVWLNYAVMQGLGFFWLWGFYFLGSHFAAYDIAILIGSPFAGLLVGKFLAAIHGR